MGSEETRSPHSRSRCRSPEDGAEGESKRRKHRHHRHRHRHHRSGHGRERHEGEVLDLEPEVGAVSAGAERIDEYEREEGEILEEEDGVEPERRDLVQGDEGVEKESRRGDVDENDSSGSRSRSWGSGEDLHRKKRKGEHGDEALPAKLGKLLLSRGSDSQDAGRKSSDRDDKPGTSRDRQRDRSRSKERERRKDSERENGRAVDKIRSNERKDDRERESSIHSRHEERGDSHGVRERDRERDRNHRRSSRDRDSVEVGKRSRGERERSISHSRHDTGGDRHDSQDREYEREQRKHSRSSLDRDGERRRAMSRDRFRERENVRERDRDGSDRDKKQLRDRETLRHDDRERGRHASRDRQRDSRNSRYDELESRNERTKPKELVREVSSATRPTEELKGKPVREEDEEDYEEKIEQQLAQQDEDDVEKIKEESRKRRLAILEKYNKQKQLAQHTEAGSNNHEKEEKQSTASPDKEKMHDLNDNAAAAGQASTQGLEHRHDPSDLYIAEPSFALGKSPVQNGKSTVDNSAVAHGLGEGTPKSERSEDMFCDDIFGESPTGVRKSGKVDGIQIEGSGLLDNWDDPEGYYSYRFGEVLDGRYEVIASHGKGVFSTVVRAKDLKAGKGDPEEVAIKIIRNNETMYKAGLEELTILKKLAGADPDDRRHCVRFISNFKYRNHLCLVFESLHMNLREVLKKFGRNIGLKLTAVRAYAKQLFIALKHLRNCGVLHCDIKPDNMLVNEAKNVLKLCDFGNAMFAGKNEITPYLVSRFYRAPEIILGLPYDHPMDIWSVGCCLYELYSGKVLFPGPSNNDMLRLHMELKGPFPKKMLRKGAFTEQHFDQDLNFHATEEDPVSKKIIKRLLLNIKLKDIGMLISGSPGEDPKMLANFKDLLERIFVLDPEKRMTVSQALSHPFITGK
ncbi:Non-specific serine/threonine protein kinase protein [Dioscorea alata]|uniref:Non-specific serine/threonine protein kinase protein n=2 Tax=Dioscorea alata TaxID=55571 RepID=A0ACB7TXX2_DIOAL|nr:Non-specific serine/threonine protein kinase protein [Dioscorea alata]KAH7652905.1 Non-specific serine/threonine protein kinase protein [Dioscorea alata]